MENTPTEIRFDTLDIARISLGVFLAMLAALLIAKHV